MPILWQEVAAYATVMTELSEPWEFRAVIDMSRAYVEEKRAGKDPFRIAPVERDADG